MDYNFGAAGEFRDNFEEIYCSAFPGMVRFAKEYVGNREDAENIVQDVFAEIWEAGWTSTYQKNRMLALLLASVKNRCLDYLRHKIVVREAEGLIQVQMRREMQMKFDSLVHFNQDLLLSGENIEDLIAKAIDALPEKCRKIFIMNKIEGKKQSAIAQELDISINTVETQMGIAYKKLREQLKNHLLILQFFIYL